MTRKSAIWLATLWLGSAAILMTSCGDSGPEFIPVIGRVVFTEDSSVAQFGSVEFRSVAKPRVIARGKIQKDGSFQLMSNGRQGTVAGKHSVVVIQVVGGPGVGRVKHNHGRETAKKYADHRTTDLFVDVQRDTADQVVLEVESKPSRAR